MNKIYKLVYSKQLNQLVAVSELAKSATVSATSKVDLDETRIADKITLNKLALSLVISSLFTALPLSVSANSKDVEKVELGTVATAVADNDATKETHINYVSKAGYSATNAGVVADANGPKVNYIENVPVIDIVKANAAGVSDNRFSKFSTDTGVIFNNVKSGSVEVNSSFVSQKIKANPNLAEAAKVILAQITGNDKSVIQGTMEVLGAKADVLLINPHGIDLNGVKLVNMKDFTAATANLVSADKYTNLQVNQGELNVNGKLTSDDVDVIRLIAAAVKIKAQISSHTKDGKRADIIVAGGKQQFDLKTNNATKLATDKGAKATDQKVVISGDILGSMYGKSVNFVVSESGAGVEYDGLVIADENLKITADGKVVTNQVFAKGDVSLESTKKSVEVGSNKSFADAQAKNEKLTSYIKSYGKVVINSADTVNTKAGTLHATKEVLVKSKGLMDVGNVQSEAIKLESDFAIRTAANTQLKANNIDVSTSRMAVFGGKVLSNKNLNVDLKTKNSKDTINSYNSIVRFNDEVISVGEATIQAARVGFNGKTTTDVSKLTDDNALFKFNNVIMEVHHNDGNLLDTLSLTNGKFIANNLGIQVFAANNLSVKPLVTTKNGAFSIYQTASLDLNRGDKTLTINNATQFKNLQDTVNTLNASLTEVKMGKVSNAANSQINIEKAVKFDVQSFENKGILTTNNSLSVVAKGDVVNSGAMYVKGNLVLNSGSKVDLTGDTYVYNSLSITSPEVYQTARVNVGGNMDVVTDKYEMDTKFKGSPKVVASEMTGAQNYHYHSLRKDKYWFVTSFGQVDTSGMSFDTVETVVLGNLNVTPLTKTQAKAAAAKDPILVVKNGRLHVGGDMTVDGSMEVSTSAFKVNAMDILKYKNTIAFKFQPISLLNTSLAPETVYSYNNLYEFFDSIEARGDAINGWIGYRIDTEQVLNTFKMAEIDPSLNRVISAIFGANWKALNKNEFVKKWNAYKANPNSVNTVIFAPNSEVLALGNFVQKNGKLFVGSENQIKTSNIVEQGVAKNKFFIKVEDSTSVDITTKLNGVRNFEDYLRMYSNVIGKDSVGQWAIVKDLGWDTYGNVAAANLKNLPLAAGDRVLSLVVMEQYKDLAGGYLSLGKSPAEVIAKLVEGTKKYEEAKKTFRLEESLKVNFSVVLDGKRVYNVDDRALHAMVDNYYDRIEWVKNAQGKYEPVVKLSTATLQKSTNFDQVAASLSAVKSLTTENNTGVEVRYGALNSKVINLDSKGDIKVTSMVGQNAISGDVTKINANNFSSLGNLRVGDLTLNAVDVSFDSLAYYTDAGYLNHQGSITGNNVNVQAEKTIVVKAADIKAEESASLKAKEEVKFETHYNQASSFDSDRIASQDSGRQVTQEGAFVDSATVEGKNVSISADKVTMESTKVVATEKAEINAGSLTTTSKGDVTEVKVDETKNSVTVNAQANFGSFKAEAAVQLLKNKDIEGNVENQIYTNTSTEGAVSSKAPVSAGLTFTIEESSTTTTKQDQVNNQLDAKHLVVNVDGHAELGNVDINTDGKTNKTFEEKLKDAEKVADITAGSISQTQEKNITIVSSTKETTTVGVEGAVDSSALQLVSHVTSAARAESMGMKVDETFAATVVGDTLGLVTKDLISGSVSVSVSNTHADSNSVTTSDNRNHVAGTVNINTSGDTQLKAISGDLKELNVEAKNLTIEGGVTTRETTFNSETVSSSVSLSGGVGLSGASTSVSGSISASETHGASSAVIHDASTLNAQKVNIKVDEKLTLDSAQLVGSEKVDIEAKKVEIISNQDTYKSNSDGKGLSFSGGASLGSASIPFGSVGAYGEKHVQDSAITKTVSGISGGEVNIKADKLEMQSGVISADKGKIEVEEIEITNNRDYDHVDGGRVGVQLGTNKTGAAIVNVNGGRDRQSDYEATVKSTIDERLTISDNAVIKSETNDTLNRDIDKVVDVVKNEVTQETTFDITVTSNMVKNTVETFEAIKDAVQNGYSNAKEAVKSYASSASKAIGEGVEISNPLSSGSSKTANADTVDIGDVEWPSYTTHYISDADVLAAGYFRPVTAVDASRYNTYSTPSSSSSSGTYRSHDVGVYNPYGNYNGSSSSYSSNSYNTSYDFATGSFSNGSRYSSYDTVSSSSLDLASSYYNNAAANNKTSTSKGFNSSLLQFDSYSASEENKDIGTTSESSSLTLDNNANKVKDVVFEEVLSSSRVDPTTTNPDTIKFVTSNIDHIGSSESYESPFFGGINFGGTDFDIVNPDREIGKIPGIDNIIPTIPDSTLSPKPIDPVTGGNSTVVNGNNGSGFGGNANNVVGNTSTGSGAGTAGNGGSNNSSSNASGMTGVGNGSTSGSTNTAQGGDSNGSDITLGGNGSSTTTAGGTSTGNGTGTNNGTAGNSVTFPSNNGATGGFDLDFVGGSDSTNNGSSVTTTGGSTNLGGGATSGTVTGNNGVSSGNNNSNAVGSTVQGGENSSVTITKPSTTPEKPSTGNSSTNVTVGSTTGSTADAPTSSTGDSVLSGTQPVEPSKPSTSVSTDSNSNSSSVTVGGSSSAGNNSTVTTDKVVNTTVNTGVQHATPADGNAKVGEKIDVGATSKVTKYQVGNLSCYVMSNNAAGKAQLANASKPRATIFSTYSTGIESLVADGGVICIPTSSQEMQTDYNVVRSVNDIPIVKSAKEEAKELEAVYVTETQTVKVKVAPNTATTTKKVVVQIVPKPTAVNVTEITNIKSTLSKNGIDAKQIMILGVKGGYNSSAADVVKKATKK